LKRPLKAKLPSRVSSKKVARAGGRSGRRKCRPNAYSQAPPRGRPVAEDSPEQALARRTERRRKPFSDIAEGGPTVCDIGREKGTVALPCGRDNTTSSGGCRTSYRARRGACNQYTKPKISSSLSRNEICSLERSCGGPHSSDPGEALAVQASEIGRIAGKGLTKRFLKPGGTPTQRMLPLQETSIEECEREAQRSSNL